MNSLPIEVDVEDSATLEEYLESLYVEEKTLYCCQQEKDKLQKRINMLGTQRVFELKTKVRTTGYLLDLFLFGCAIAYLIWLRIIDASSWRYMPLPGRITTVIVLLFTIGGGIVDILGRREKNRQIIEEHKRNQLEIQKDKKRIESELKKVSAVKAQLEQCEKNIKDTEEILQHLYEIGRFFPKYRNLVAVSQIYEYILSGRCTELGGFQGAYNLYEQETRMDIVIMRLDDIYEELEEIKENQYMLYDAICQTNYMLSQIADDAAVAAYNTEVIITNQRICQRYYMV